MRSELSGEGEVVQAGDAEHRVVNAVALEAAVPQDFPVLQPGQGVFDPGSRPAVDGVLRFLLRTEMGLATLFAVRDEQAGALVSAIGDGRGSAAARSMPDSVKARQSLRLPGSGRPMATTSRLLASITSCRLVEYR